MDRCQQAPRRKRQGEVLFIDARELGQRTDRAHRELTDEDIRRVAGTYHAWRGDKGAGRYSEVPGFCRAASREEIAAQGYTLTPGRYVGAQARASQEQQEPFARVMPRLVRELEQHLSEAHGLEQRIRESLRRLSDGG